MLKKRLIGVVTVRGGWAVQSFGYRRWLPLGRPEVLIENLDRWGVDEILLQCIDRSAADSGPDLTLLERIGRLGLSTPLIYAGGIASVEQANAVVHAAADRIIVDSLLHDAPGRVAEIASHLGAQAVIGGFPLATGAGGLTWLDHRRHTSGPLSVAALSLFERGLISEALVIDWRHEGQRGGFDEALVRDFPLRDVPLIAFGGLSEAAQHRRLLENPLVVATAVGNFLSYREHAAQSLKAALGGLPLRAPAYSNA